ncbi:hypothetical protein GCM10009839_81280 [Catenulispora yoronensis]|uniref:Uncharacterized protein n=1 Tax=Catenulispora yoronensis TaxID=450799 RepID=A0ABP5GY00_9ACTN
MTEVSFPLATLTWICEAGSAFDVFVDGLMTTTAADDAEDVAVLGAAPGPDDDVPSAAGAEDPEVGPPLGGGADFGPPPPPPQPAASVATVIMRASFRSPRIIASCARSYNQLVPMPRSVLSNR